LFEEQGTVDPMKRVALLISVMLVAAACASATETPTDAGASTANPPNLTPDNLIAPDFTLALASGDSFTLSDEKKLVYMIFWAEW